MSVNQTSIRRPIKSANENEEEEDDDDDFEIHANEHSISRDDFLFVFLDMKNPINRDLIGPFRSIYDNVKLYSKSSSCLKYLRCSNEKILFITTSNDKDLIKQIQDCSSVEAIFIFNTQGDFDQIRYSKFVGIYKHSEELLVALKHAFEWFRESQFDFYTFERQPLFLYLQIWREVYSINKEKKQLFFFCCSSFYSLSDRYNHKLVQLNRILLNMLKNTIEEI